MKSNVYKLFLISLLSQGIKAADEDNDSKVIAAVIVSCVVGGLVLFLFALYCVCSRCYKDPNRTARAFSKAQKNAYDQDVSLGKMQLNRLKDQD